VSREARLTISVAVAGLAVAATKAEKEGFEPSMEVYTPITP
jgi:hypothetical protein